MKTSREQVMKKGLASIKVFKVPSNTDPKTVYNVLQFRDGHYTCDCIAGLYGRECVHIKSVKSKK